jgi:hypothetical protein
VVGVKGLVFLESHRVVLLFLGRAMLVEQLLVPEVGLEGALER